MKKPRILTFVSEEIASSLESLKGTSLKVNVAIVFRDQDEKIWTCNKVIRCKLRKEKGVTPAPVVEEVTG